MNPLRLLLLASLAFVPGTLPLLSAAEFNAATATNQVGLDLFRQLATQQPTGNLVLSPYSIESALALAYAGADGVTRTEMSRALHLPADTAVVQAGFATLRTGLDEIARQSQLLSERRRDPG